MRLVAAEVAGYKRFSAESEMDLDAEVICIVGPNGAGKSSFLDALDHLDGDTQFAPAEQTRTEGGGTQAPRLRADYVLENHDREALASVPEAGAATGFRVSKYDDGSRRFLVSPRPKRDLAKRQSTAAVVADLQSSPWLESEAERERGLDEQPHPILDELVGDVLIALESDEETLGEDDEIVELNRLRDRLQAVIPDADDGDDAGAIPKKYRRLPLVLQGLVEHETVAHPHLRAIAALRPRRPRFMKFDDAQRGLDAVYDLNGDSDPAIRNLLTLAGTSWGEVREVVQSGDKGRKNVLLDRTRQTLEQRITVAWGQTPIKVSFDFDGPILTILMSMQAEDYIQIDQHSDGLRQFVALRAFIALADEDRFVLFFEDRYQIGLGVVMQVGFGLVDQNDRTRSQDHLFHPLGWLSPARSWGWGPRHRAG